jgi:hypothetical protein
MSVTSSTSSPLAKPMGAWGAGKSANLITNLKTPKTQEQIQQDAKDAAARDKAKADAALNAAAEQLVNRVEAIIKQRSGGVSSNYGSDEQYTVTDTYTREVVQLAFTKWLDIYHKKNEDQALHVHMMQPKAKLTGNRNGTVQANFIRKVVAQKDGRYNIHINIKD